jgi:alkylation response protein AidB-like acyl-CoA dehydrogenase
MDFNLSEEQQMLSESIGRFVEKKYGPNERKHIVKSDDGFSQVHWQCLAEIGLLGLLIERFGGIGGNPTDVLVVMEALGRGLLVEPFVSTSVVAVSIISKLGTELQKEKFLPGMIGGDVKVSLAALEPQSRFDLWDIETKAISCDGGWLLEGRKAVVLHGGVADYLIVAARTSGDVCDRDGISLFIVESGRSGIEIQQFPGMDGHHSAEILFSGVKVDASDLLGATNNGFENLEWAVDRGIAALCAEAVGAMQRLSEMTEEYVMTRQQFGQPIGKFQSIQHHIANMRIAIDQARSCAFLAAANVDDENAVQRRRAVSTAKALIGRSGRFVGETALQLHGGIGMTEELPVGDYLKRLACIDMTWGDTAHHLELYSEVMSCY